MKRLAVIDSSPLINLVHLELAQSLSAYFDVVYVPRMVQTEVNRKSRFRYRLRKLYARGVFTQCRVADPISVELLLREGLDKGEAEALIQGSEQGVATFIGDDISARKSSERRGIRPVGTVRLLARMNQDGYAGDPRQISQQAQTGTKLPCRRSGGRGSDSEGA